MTVELVWPGKYDAHGRRVVPDVPAGVLEPWEQTGAPEASHRLLQGDNLGLLTALEPELGGRVDLVYVDPPFATGGRFMVATRVGEADGPDAREVSAVAYDDRFEGGAGGFIGWLEPRLSLLHRLLAPHGSFYLHVDPRYGHAVKLLLDEVFGERCFQREIVWRIGWVSGYKTKARNWIRNHDTIFFYTKDPQQFTFNKLYTPYPPGYRRRDGALPRGEGIAVDDVWNANEAEFALRGRDSLDSIQIKSFSTEKTGYATQKNESLLRRIVEASSHPGDLVLDAFCGSGTTGAVAAALGRRFVGCDVNPTAIHIAKKRILAVSSDVTVERFVPAAAAPVACAAPSEPPEVDLELERGPLVVVRLRAYGYPCAEALPVALRGLAAEGLELVDAWWVGLDGHPPQVLAHRFRDHRKRALEREIEISVPAGARLRVRVVDVLHRVVDRVVFLAEGAVREPSTPAAGTR